MSDKIFEQLCREIGAAMGLEPAGIRPEDCLVSDLGAESLDLVDLTFRIEKTFNIQIPQGELFESKAGDLQRLSVRDVADYILTAQTSQAS